MTCSNITNDELSGLPVFDTRKDGFDLPALIATLWPRRRPARIDVRYLPDHIKRDIGILDGNQPSGGVKW